MPRIALVLPMILPLLACHSHGASVDLYEGCASDENAQVLAEYEARLSSDATAAPRWLNPASGARLPKNAPPTFTWQPTPGDPGRPNGTASCEQCPTCSVLGPAHLPPVSGNVYDLQVLAGGQTVYRVLTTLQRFTPPSDRWAAWRGPVALSLTRAPLLRNEVVDGPYRAAALSIEITE